MSGIAILSAIGSVVVFVAFIFLVLNGSSSLNASYLNGVSTDQSVSSNTSTKLSDGSPQSSQQQIADNRAYDAQLPILAQRHPELNASSPQFEQATVWKMEARVQAHIDEGHRPVEALSLAEAEVFRPAPALSAPASSEISSVESSPKTQSNCNERLKRFGYTPTPRAGICELKVGDKTTHEKCPPCEE